MHSPHLHWRGEALVLRDLRTQPATGGTVVVMRKQQDRLGVIVDGLRTLVQARSARVARGSVAGEGNTDFITTGKGADQATYVMRDLAQRLGLDGLARDCATGR